jgi:outer membrane receptor for ferrienterochelin and colicins
MINLRESPMIIFVPGSYHHPLLLTVGIMVGVLCCWLLMSMGTARAQSDLPPDLPASATPTGDGEESIVFQNIPSVYGAVKYDQKVTEAPASITIITADQIKKYGYRNFTQILDSVPGFFTTNDRNYDYVGIRGFNRPGDYNSRVLLLIDNHRLNDAVYDQAPIGNDGPIDVDLIDRVEIIRGPSSSLYGTNAFFGVINVITKRGKDLKGLEVSGEAGTFDSYKSRMSYGNKFNNGLEFLVSGSYLDSVGPRDLFYKEFNDPATNNGHAIKSDSENFQNFFGKASYGDFTLQGGYVSRKKKVPTASFNTIFNSGAEGTLDQRGYLDLKYRHEFANDLALNVRGYYDRYSYRGDFPLDYPPPTLNQDHTQTQQGGAEVTVVKRLFNRHKVILGTEYRDQFQADQNNKDNAPQVTYLDDHRPSTVWALFGQDEWAITDHLLLNAGIRHDHYSTFGGTTNPRVGLIYNWTDTTAKLLYGRAFRAPNPFEQHYNTIGFLANQNIAPERITTYEAVVEQSLTANLRASATLYHYQIKGLISQVSLPGADGTLGTADDELQYQNAESIKANGMELTLEGKWPSGVEGRLSYALQKAKDDATGMRLSNSPQSLTKLNVIVPLFSDKIFGGLETRYTSRRDTLAGNQAKEVFLTNLSLFSTRLVKGWELSGQLSNLFNYHYADPGSGDHLQDTIEQNGRTFWVKLKFRY